MQTGEVGVTKAGDAERRRGLEETGVVTLERRPGLCFLARWERGATDGTRSPHGEPKLSESEPERPGLEHDEPAGGVQATPRREELGPLQLLFARLEQEPDDAATLSALCDLALTRGQPELAQRLIRQARATGRELPKELQALARRANATPSVLPQVLGTARDARSCCLLPVLIGLVSLLGALLGAGVMSVPDLRMRLRVSNQRGRLASSSFAERRAGTTWLTQEGLRLAKFVDSAEVEQILREAHAAVAPGPLSRADALEALEILAQSLPPREDLLEWGQTSGIYGGERERGEWGPGWAEAVATGLEHGDRLVRLRAAMLLAERYVELRQRRVTQLPDQAWAATAEAYAAHSELRALLLPLLVDERSLPQEVVTLTDSGPLLIPSLPSTRTPEELRAHFRDQPRALLALLLDAYASDDASLRQSALTEARWVLPRYRTQALAGGEWDPRLRALTLACLRQGRGSRAPRRSESKVRWTPIAELALGLGVEEGADAYLRLVRSAYERYQRGKLKKAKRYSRQARRYAKRNPTHATSLLQDARRARHQARNPDSSWIRRYSPALRRLPRETLQRLQQQERNHGASVVIEDALGGGS